MDRRTFLITSAAAATGAALGTAVAAETEGPFGATGVPLPLEHGEGLPLGPLSNSRHPDAHIETLDRRFKGRVGETAVERVATGFRWAEGPAYFAAGRFLVFSDIPNNRMMRLLEDDNHLSVFRYPSLNSNGNTVDHQGRLCTCEHAGRRVTRTEYDGAITVVADRYNGRKLNSPNDIVVASNGSIWFTDPTYGVKGWYEGFPRDIEQDKNNVFRVDAKTGEIKVVVDDFVQPNGIMFSPDEKKLYIIDTGLSEGQNPPNIRVFDVDIDTGRLSNGKVFVEGMWPGGVTDGMRCDVEGNVWCAMGWGDPKEDGVRCYAPDGTLLAKIHLPETTANLTFGGESRNRLYICATSSVYACYVNTQGAAPG
jgi:gluconolactonase